MSRRSLPACLSSPLLSLLAALSLPLVACSSDAPQPAGPATPQPDAGADTSPSDAAEQPDALMTDQDAAPDAAAGVRLALFTASDFTTTAQLGVLDLGKAPPAAFPTTSFDDQDSMVVADRTYAFVLHRTQGTVSVLRNDGSAAVVRDVNVNAAGADAGKANPYAVVMPANDKAYVIRYGLNSVAVIDPTSSTAATTEIDLSEFVADPDGLVDAFAGVYDPSTGRAYIGLQRIDQNSFGAAPDYVSPCLAARAAIVGIDTSTDTVLDLNGAGQGKLIELDVADPGAMVLDEASHRIIVMGVGCADAADGGQGRSGRGVQSVDLSDGTVAWLWQTQALPRPAALLWMGTHEALVGLDDESFTRHWYVWDPATPSLGVELQGVPQVPTWDGQRGLIGLDSDSVDAGSVLDVVRYDLDTNTSSVLVPSAFTSPGLVPYSSATAR